ncbi:antitoxin [Methanosarcina spelaei]|uniref:Antitoxin n=1 Tax=Methanosarcina spelaei TaxID=1036679 RepID=A0A2A2HPD5_9EURY|nr:DUF2683 family protein [Methanosarcina spelaei]PAV11210.1 antitoxin [Methanosarcina spelaei]
MYIYEIIPYIYEVYIIVQAVIRIDEKTNRVLNIIKAKYGLKDKSAAIMHMAAEYEKELMEPELRPEFIEKAQEIMKQEPIDVGTIENWKKMLNS